MTPLKLSIAALALSACMPYDHYTAGMHAMNVKQYPDAQKEFKLVPKDNFRYQEAQFELGVILYALHDLDHALQQMIAARALSPERFEKERAMVKGLGLVHAELTHKWDVKTDGVIEDVKQVGDVLLTVNKDGTVQARKGEQLLWESPLGPRSNMGRAIPVVDGDLVYVVKEHRPTQLLALKLATGEQVWAHELGGQYEFSNVAVDGHAVYVGDSARGKYSLNALDKRTGRPLWTTPVDGIPGAIVAGHDRVWAHTKDNHITCFGADGHAKLIDYALTGHLDEQTQLVMTDQSLYVSEGSSLYALRFTSAPLAWKQSIQNAGGLSAAALVDDGKKLVVQTRTALRAFDAQTGSPLWLVSSPTEDGAWSRAGKLPPEIGGAIVGWGESYVFGVSSDGKLLWQLAFDGSLSAAPVPVGDDTLVLAVHGHQEALVATAPRKLFD